MVVIGTSRGTQFLKNQTVLLHIFDKTILCHTTDIVMWVSYLSSVSMLCQIPVTLKPFVAMQDKLLGN